jgi:hypothetical protein
VSCTSSSACVAVGSAYSGGDSAPYGILARWNGLIWALLAQGGQGEGYQLYDVSCATTRLCIAVGAGHGPLGDDPASPLADLRRGRDWISEPGITPVVPPAMSQAPGIFVSGACPKRRLCFAVGAYGIPTGQSETLIERYG